MFFDLKNVGVIYQRLVNQMFALKIRRTMKVYVDDMLVKSLQVEDHLAHLAKMFVVLRTYKMKLNLSKCTFEVFSGKFLGFMVNQ